MTDQSKEAYWREIAGDALGDFMQFGCHEDDCEFIAGFLAALSPPPGE